MKVNFLTVSFWVSLLFLSGCKTNSLTRDAYTVNKQSVGSEGVVVSAHPLASRVGVEILKKGGNAIDAAIAVQLALAVVYPGAGNIGGGGFMVYTDKNGNAATLDFREKAPGKAHRNMYLDAEGNPVADLSTTGHLSAGVPGTIDGIFAMFERYSKLKDFASLIDPAIQLAASGFRITQREAMNLNIERNVFRKLNNYSIAFVKDELWKAGDVLIQPELANTLSRIKEKGRAEFYEGQTADMLVKSQQMNGGIMTADDLRQYKSVWRKPIIRKYRGYEVVSMAPPSSGGIILMQMLKMLEPYDIASLGFQSGQHIHLLTEAERRAYADRSVYLGDPEFNKMPVNHLLDSMYIASRMRSFQQSRATPSSSVKAGVAPLPQESEETTHLSIIDSNGNAVSITTTLNSSYGSRVVVEGAGFLLNNEMDDFSIKPGTPNLYGLVGGEANAIAPGKRMLSSMTPTILLKDGQVYAVIGSPGGSTIITSVMQVIVNLVDFKMSPFDAVQSPRFHSQWLPDKIFVEEGSWKPALIEELQRMGHVVEIRAPIGRVEAIVVKGGLAVGVADKRGDDAAESVK